MATVTIGRVKFVWQGTYAGGTAYVVDDVVYYNGSAYICKLASTGNLPTNGTYWDKLAQGSDLQNISGLQANDIAYYDGSNWARLALGAANKALKVNAAANGLEYGDAGGGGLLQAKHYRKESTMDDNSTSDSVLGSPFNGSNGITPTAAGNFIGVHFMCNVDHGTTWRSDHIRAQFSTDGGSNYKDFMGGAQSAYNPGTPMHGNQISCFGLIPNQSTTNEHKIRLVKNGHSSGSGRRLGQFANQGEDNSNNSNPNSGDYSIGLCMTLFEYDSSIASVTEVS